MAIVTVMKEKKYKIDKEIGRRIIEDYFSDYDCFVDENEEILFEDLNIENSIIFLKELKEQLVNAMNDKIKEYTNAEEHYEDIKLNLIKMMDK